MTKSAMAALKKRSEFECCFVKTNYPAHIRLSLERLPTYRISVCA